MVNTTQKEMTLIDLLDEARNKIPRRWSFYGSLKMHLRNENYHEIITYSIRFLIDNYFDVGFYKNSKEEILISSRILDFLEGILVAELLNTDLDEEDREEYKQVSEMFSYYRKNDTAFKANKISLSDNLKWTGRTYKQFLKKYCAEE